MGVQPHVDARRVERVWALGQPTQLLSFLELAQADRGRVIADLNHLFSVLMCRDQLRHGALKARHLDNGILTLRLARGWARTAAAPADHQQW